MLRSVFIFLLCRGESMGLFLFGLLKTDVDNPDRDIGGSLGSFHKKRCIAGCSYFDQRSNGTHPHFLGLKNTLGRSSKYVRSLNLSACQVPSLCKICCFYHKSLMPAIFLHQSAKLIYNFYLKNADLCVNFCECTFFFSFLRFLLEY